MQIVQSVLGVRTILVIGVHAAVIGSGPDSVVIGAGSIPGLRAVAGAA
ncbi:MAG: hypothetical protein IKS29_03180 [Oscillospiraceae bacterium]|nr:hypothetical protein [Oscillospiraceae bacterium]